MKLYALVWYFQDKVGLEKVLKCKLHAHLRLSKQNSLRFPQHYAFCSFDSKKFTYQSMINAISRAPKKCATSRSGYRVTPFLCTCAILWIIRNIGCWDGTEPILHRDNTQVLEIFENLLKCSLASWSYKDRKYYLWIHYRTIHLYSHMVHSESTFLPNCIKHWIFDLTNRILTYLSF